MTCRLFRLPALVFAIAALASCATPPSREEAVDGLRSARVCCESTAQFKYEPIGDGGGARVDLDRSAEAFDFPTGKSYFKAFRLPGRAPPYRVRVRSFALGDHIDRAHVFYPQIALLDERFAAVGQSDPREFALSRASDEETASATWGLPVKIEGYVLVNDARAKYLVVYTTQELMRGASPYEAQRIAPVILPGVVTAIPTHKEQVLVRHSPFGLLHLEIAAARPATCPQGGEADIEPKSAVVARLVGRDARLFVAAIEPGADATRFDAVVILRGADVLGGTVAVVLEEGCLAGRKFLSGLDYIHAAQMVALFRADPALQETDRLEMARLRPMAEAGDATAQFHVGLADAWGRGVPPDRKAAIEWLDRSAHRGFAPAMLALGMALSGPGALVDEAQAVGKPPRRDEHTDLVMAYVWLSAASRSGERDVRDEAALRLGELGARLSPEERRKAEDLVRERRGAHP